MVTIAITVLIATKVTMATMVMIFTEYSGYHNVFFSDSVVELPKHTNINNNHIDLIDNLLSYPPALRYHLSIRKTVAFNCVSEVSIT